MSEHWSQQGVYVSAAGRRRKWAHVWRKRFEGKEQRQDGGQAAEMGGLTGPYTDRCEEARRKGPEEAALPSTPPSIRRL